MITFHRQHAASRGIGLIEAVVAVAIVGTTIVSAIGVFHLLLRQSVQSTPEIKAVFLVGEGLEAARAIRDIDWATEIDPLALETPYYLSFSGGRWTLTTTASLIDGVFDRTVTFSGVDRDSDGRIVASGGTNDAGTREVAVTVAWASGGGTLTKEASLYLTDLFSE